MPLKAVFVKTVSVYAKVDHSWKFFESVEVNATEGCFWLRLYARVSMHRCVCVCVCVCVSV